MSKILKNLLPFWKMVICILVLLCVQAFCDLSLPAYTSDIIDVGIQNKGICHVLPEKITEEDYSYLQIFMTQEEKDIWNSVYDQSGSEYKKKKIASKTEQEYDSRFSTVFLMDKQFRALGEEQFRQMLLQQPNMNEDMVKDLSLPDMVEWMHADLTINEKEEENDKGELVTVYSVDIRPMFLNLIATGQMDNSTLQTMREQMEEKMSAMGESLLKASAISDTILVVENAGVDTNQLQIAYLWKAGAKMLSFALIMAVATVLVGYFASRIGAGIGRNLRETMFKKVVRFSNKEMDRFSTASLITRTTNDVQQIQMVTTMMLRMVAYAPILGIGGIMKVYETKAGMGWVIALAVLLILGFVGVLMSVAMPKFKRMQVLIDRVNLVSREILTGLSVIRAFGREKEEEKRFEQANKELTGTMLFTNRVMTFMMPGMMLIMNGVTVLIVWVASHKIDNGVMEVGAMTAFITYAMMIIMSFLMLTVLSIMLPRAAVAANRIDEVEKTELSIVEVDSVQQASEKKGVVAFEHVNFRYEGAKEDVLSDIDFVAEPGKTTAIIGSTGCGKSTLVQLIPRLYDVTAGKITIDGLDIRQWSMKELREQIGFVPQKGVLFSGTIASNLRFGNHHATEEEMKEAAQIAQATEFIEKKEKGLESAISQGGTNVSGGQKQRLAIARAIAKKAKIYIFDDSFSALDLKTDAAVRKALGEKMTDATVIIVAQRISTILQADQILVVDDGRIVGKGTHEELLKNCEVYLQIAESQMSASELGLDGKEA